MEIIPYLFSRCLIFLAEDVFIMVISFPVRKKFRGGLTLHEYRSLSSVVTKTDSTKEINFLDVTLYKGTNFKDNQTLDIRTYTKPTNKQTYVHRSSFHPRGVAKSIAIGEALRFLRTNTDESNFQQRTQKLLKTLLARGYKEKAIRTYIKQIKFRNRHQSIHKSKKETKLPDTPIMALTYNKHVPLVREELNKIWLDVEKDPLLHKLYPEPPRIALKRNRSLRDLLVRARLKKTTPLAFPKDGQRLDTLKHCQIPTDFPNNLYTKKT